MLSKHPLNKLFRAIFTLCGFTIAAFGVEGFLQPNSLIDGGITGVSMLIASLTGTSFPLLLILINAPFLLLALGRLGPKFCIKAGLGILGLALVLHFFDFPLVTSDRLLASIFGGIALGAGIGLSIRGGGVLDGTEILALLLSRHAGLTVGDIILGFNIILFSTAAFFLGIEPAMYSILTYAAASKTVDFLIHGLEEYYGVIVVSTKSELVRQALVKDLGRAVTRYSGISGFSDTAIEILFCVATRLEIFRLRSAVTDIDPSAFVVIQHVSEVWGGTVRRPITERIVNRA